jgi:hypothetical protein
MTLACLNSLRNLLVDNMIVEEGDHPFLGLCPRVFDEFQIDTIEASCFPRFDSNQRHIELLQVYEIIWGTFNILQFPHVAGCGVRFPGYI